ncbi:MAG: translation initiation factor [Chthoniobacter sp.]|nr:translation initiation factor [Chthoniobacter sp.]
MPREEKNRIETNAAQSPRAGLNAAFAGLEMGDLPAAPESAPVPTPPLPVWKMGRVVLRRETAQRGGKTVIVIHDFATHLPGSVIETVAKKVRVACGCGGTVKGRTIEIQGDQATKIRAVLTGEGFQVAGVK